MRRKNVKRPSWFRVPTETPEVTALVYGHPDGLAHLGIWERMQAWAVRNWHTEGEFSTAEGHMSVEEITYHVGLPASVDVVTHALARFVKLGWLALAESVVESSTKVPAHVVESSTKRPANVAEKGSRRVDKIREDKREHTSAPQKRRRRSRIQWSVESGWAGITDDDRQRWGDAYPVVAIDEQLARMDDWLRANPSKANKSQWSRFVTGWLSREQDRAAERNQRVTGQPTQSAGWAAEAAGGDQ
jgi:hypothetical protein